MRWDGDERTPIHSVFKWVFIKLSGANHTPGQATWTTSPKVYAQIYIDDAALGCPTNYDGTGRPYVDWHIVAKAFGYDYDKLLESK